MSAAAIPALAACLALAVPLAESAGDRPAGAAARRSSPRARERAWEAAARAEGDAEARWRAALHLEKQVGEADERVRAQRAHLEAEVAARLARRTRALEGGARALRALHEAASAVVPALDEDADAARRALEAMLGYASASGPERVPMARRADEAAERRGARADVLAERLRAVAKAEEALASSAAAARRDQAAALAALAERSDGAAALTSTWSVLAAAASRRAVDAHVRAALRDAFEEAAREARALRAALEALSVGLAEGDEAVDLERLAPADLGARELLPYVTAERDEEVARAARAFWTRAQQSCADDAACTASLAAEIAVADAELEAATRETEARRQKAVDEPARLAALLATWTSLQGRARAGDARADRLEPLLGRLDTPVATARRLSRASAARLEASYAAARRAAEAAYLAAYGTRRLEVAEQAGVEAVAVAAAAAAAATPIEQVTTHAFQAVTRSVLDRLPRHGAYTYVLFAQYASAAAEPVRRRYQALLDAIVSTTAPLDLLRDVERKRVNVFCIPTRVGAPRVEGEFDLAAYDFGLSLGLLATAGNGTVLVPEIIRRLRRSPGPFLLTSFAPLAEVKTSSPLLFADLSGYAPESYTTLVARYKEQLVEEPPSHQEQLRVSTLQWAFARGPIVYADARKVATQVKELFDGWFGGSVGKAALLAEAADAAPSSATEPVRWEGAPAAVR